jgi:hypothetical protein
MYNDGDAISLYLYVKSIMETVLSRVTVINISDYLERGTLFPIISTGDFIFLQGAYVFRQKVKDNQGLGQLSEGVRRANGVEVRFAFDRWEATSMSAWGLWLHGRQALGAIIQVKDISRENDVLVIQGTVLGIAQGLRELKKRDYFSPLPFFGRPDEGDSNPIDDEPPREEV